MPLKHKLRFFVFFTMDSIKSKMLSLSQATSEALARTAVFEEELRKNNEIADRYEEQVNGNSIKKFSTQSFKNKILAMIFVEFFLPSWI